MIKRRNTLTKILGGITALTLSASVMTVNSFGAICSKAFYCGVTCSSCDYSYSNSVDNCSGKHKRQYGIKLCTAHKNAISSEAEYYKRGYSDYNCLAYALGKNSPGSWEWKKSWGTTGPTREEFVEYIIAKGYSYADQASIAKGKKVFYVYEKDGIITHFARKYTLDSKSLDGYVTISKWGSCSLYKSKTINPYNNSEASYGKMVLVCYK